VWRFVVAVIAVAALGAFGSSAAPQPMRSNQLAQAQTSTASAQLDMDAVPSLTAEGIRQVQQALAKKGFDPGPIDGVLGPLTEQALRKFQDHYGIKVTGLIDNQTLYALGEAQLAGQARQ
jgi:peptidoglycan hydrolase-like protein with peptidoglycan-binding domain